MSPADERFKFPVRAYDPVEREQEQHTQELTSSPPDHVVRDFAVGWQRVYIEEIDRYGEAFARGRTIKDVKKYGFDGVLVSVGQDDFFCDWDLKTFEKEYNKHCRKLLKRQKQLEEGSNVMFLSPEEIIKELQNGNTKG